MLCKPYLLAFFVALTNELHSAEGGPAEPAARVPFVLLAQRKGGSTWVGEMLQAHGEVCCEGEAISSTTGQFVCGFNTSFYVRAPGHEGEAFNLETRLSSAPSKKWATRLTDDWVGWLDEML